MIERHPPREVKRGMSPSTAIDLRESEWFPGMGSRM